MSEMETYSNVGDEYPFRASWCRDSELVVFAAAVLRLKRALWLVFVVDTKMLRVLSWLDRKL